MSGFKQSFVTPLTSLRASTEQLDQLGSIRVELNKVYKYCMLKLAPDADVDAVAGDQLVYTDYSAHEVGTDATDIEATNLAAGISGVTIDMSADKGKYLWVQIKGPATVAQAVAGTPVAGSDIQASTTDLTFTKSVTLVQRAGTYIGGSPVEVILDCPF